MNSMNLRLKKMHGCSFIFHISRTSEYELQEKYINAYYDMMKKSFKGTILNKPRRFHIP